jgi:hypothetical protein
MATDTNTLGPIDQDTFIPWGLHPIKPWVIKELQNRSSDHGLDGAGAGKRNAVKTPWARFFSNGIPTTVVDNMKVNDTSKNLDGFLMFGVNGFDASLGFNPEKLSTIGLDANGKPHTVSSETSTTFPHRPPPSVDDISVELQGGQSAPFSSACRKTTIKWKAYSLEQLNYLAPYFLSPKVTCVVEWGWDNYDPSSLIDYNIEKLRPIFGNPKAILEKAKISNGNYDAHMGIINDYSYKLSGNGVYECSTTIVSVAWLFEGQNYGDETLQRKNKNGKLEKVESFSEFNKYSKWDSIGLYLVSPETFYKFFPKDFPDPKGRVFNFGLGAFYPTNKQWIRMDYFVEILNHFFTTNFPAVFLDKNNKETQFQWQKIKIDNVLIGAHPGLKSIDPDIVIPNKFSPKYIRSDTSGRVVGTGNLSTIENGEHYKKYGRIQSVLNEFEFTDQYDDLQALLNTHVDPNFKGKSFPIFSDSDVTDEYARNFYKQSTGYFGYLKDIYISTEFIKNAAKENGTVKSMMSSIFSKISRALSGVNELRLMPDTNNNENYVTVMDIKFAPVLNEKTAAELTRIVPGSVNHAYLLSAGMDVKMSPEMSNQVLFTAGSAELAEREKGKKAPNDTENKDDDKTKPTENAESFGRFVSNDRLAEKAYKSPSTTSNTDAKNEKAKLSRNTSDEGFNICSRGNVDFYLNEPSDTLMKQIVMEDKNAAAAYVNTPVMPNTTFEFEILGIAGFTFLGMYTLDHVPEQYSYKNAIWSIKSVKHTISYGTWKTTIGAELRQISRTRQ